MAKPILSERNLRRFRYNAKDVCYTLSVDKVLTEVLANEDPSLQQFYVFQQSQVCKHITTLMNRGVNVNLAYKETLKQEYTLLQQHAKELLQWLVGDSDFNPDSTAQVKTLFKDLCGIKPVIDKKTKSESFGAKAMLVYLEDYPEWKTLLHLYLEYKRLGVFVRTFLSARVSDDGKMRCSYNVAGTKTYRLASRKNIDGGGLNLQNLPSGARGGFNLDVCLQDYREDANEDSYEDVINDGVETEEVNSVIDLNTNFGRVKDIFVPDSSDWIFFDADYSAIDAHFVYWESDCKWAKEVLKRGDCVYRTLAELYYGYPITKKMEERQIFKAIVHGSNYKGLSPTLAAAAGLSVPAVERVRKFYFDKCPEIPRWWDRVDNDVRTKGYTTNIFGARFWCPDLKDPMYMNKMVAAPIQAAAGILVNKALCRLEEGERNRLNGVQVRMQVHDSLAGLFHVTDTTAIDRIKQYMTIEVPYANDPLIIPAAIKVSDKSYGQCA